MPSAVRDHAGRLRKRIILAMMVALAVALNLLEGSLPNPFPWVRLGLANAITLLVLVSWGFREALAVSVARVVLASLVSGGLMGPAFLLALGGGLAGTVVMGLMLATGLFSVVGLSVGGSFAHTLTQFALLSILVFRDGSAMGMSTPFLLLSLPAGAIVGWVVMKSEHAVTGTGEGAA